MRLVAGTFETNSRGYSFEWKAYFKELKSDFAIRLLLWFPLGGLYVVTVLFLR